MHLTESSAPRHAHDAVATTCVSSIYAHIVTFASIHKSFILGYNHVLCGQSQVSTINVEIYENRYENSKKSYLSRNIDLWQTADKHMVVFWLRGRV